MFLYGFDVDYSVVATLRIVIPSSPVRTRLVNPKFIMASIRKIPQGRLRGFLARSYNGYYVGLSIPSSEFDSPSSRQVLNNR